VTRLRRGKSLYVHGKNEIPTWSGFFVVGCSVSLASMRYAYSATVGEKLIIPASRRCQSLVVSVSLVSMRYAYSANVGDVVFYWLKSRRNPEN